MEPLPFIPGQIIKRSTIHDRFGGNPQSGISPSAKFPYIFIFSSPAGHQHGYKDEWVNPNVYSYTGHGQSGDMKFVSGNLAIRDHLKVGKRVFLFIETYRSHFKFECELEFNEFEYFPSNDINGQERNAIKFFFRRAGVILEYRTNTPRPDITAEPLFINDLTLLSDTESRRLVTTRVGQDAYRLGIIHRWENKCAVTGFNDSRILIASHIHPWKDSKAKERWDIDNGILLSPTYDALFDRHLISFENTGKIILSDSIRSEAYEKIDVTGKEKIKKLSTSNYLYLEKHRIQFNVSS